MLDDIDWRAGELVVHGKGREDRLPLPVDVGEALADYVQRGRPRFACERLFLRVHAPTGGLSGGGVSENRPRRMRPLRAPGSWRAPAAAHGRDRDAARRRLAA